MVFSNWDPLSELCTLNIFFSNLLHFLQHFLFNAQQCVSNLFEILWWATAAKIMSFNTSSDIFAQNRSMQCTKKLCRKKVIVCFLSLGIFNIWYFKRINIDYATEFCYLINFRYCGIWILQRILTWDLVELAPWSAWTFNLNVWKWFFR